MPNIYDYLKEYGGITTEFACLSAVDFLIMSRISYLPFEGILSSDFAEGISISEANAILQAKGASADYIMQADKNLLPAVAAAPRFCDMLLSGFVNIRDEVAQMQFSAMVIKPGLNKSFIAYRGTDASMIGWKEDFNMSFMSQVPAQLKAVKYLNKAAASLEGPLILGGHSKGGNLAVYSGAFCQPIVQKRIRAIYNFDGPGQHAETMQTKGYAAVSKKIRTIIPQSSVVGILLEHEDDYAIVRSSEFGFMQHDLYSWEVDGNSLIYLDEVSSGSRFLDQSLRMWLAEVDVKTRSDFIEGLYALLNANGAKDFKELMSKKWYANALGAISAFINLDERLRKALARALWSFIKSCKENLHVFVPDFKASKNNGNTLDES